MAIVSPFRGIHYDLSRVTNLSRVISQPYDVISPEEQQSLHQRHPRNIVWIDFGLDSEGDGPTANKYTRAATWYRQWKSEGTLVRDTAPSLYYYEQEFSLPGRGGFVRKGFLGALRLSAFGEGMVLPHEKTHSRPKEDRLSLMRATEANTSPIFGLYSDPRDEVAKVLRGRLAGTPDFSATDDLGVNTRRGALVPSPPRGDPLGPGLPRGGFRRPCEPPSPRGSPPGLARGRAEGDGGGGEKREGERVHIVSFPDPARFGEENPSP